MEKLVIFVVIILIAFLIYSEIKNHKRSKTEATTYDLIVEFKDIDDQSFMKDPQTLNVYHYRSFGKGYRGNSTLTKDQLIQFFVDTYAISITNTKVVEPNSSMFFIGK